MPAPLKSLVIHPGYPKTATSLLQRTVFRSLPAMGKESVHPGAGWISQKESNAILLHRSPDFWQSDRGSRLLAGLASTWQEGAMLWSDETWLWGPPTFCPEAKRPTSLAQDGQHRLVAHMEVLRKALEQRGILLKLFICVREQTEFLGSMYAQCAPRMRAQASQAQFVKLVRQLLDDESADGWRYLAYTRLALALKKVLGADNLLILPYARIRTQPFWTAAEAFSGLDFVWQDALLRSRENVRSSGHMSWAIDAPRRIPALRRMLGPIDGVGRRLTGRSLLAGVEQIERRLASRIEISMDESTCALVRERYKEDSTLLESNCP